VGGAENGLHHVERSQLDYQTSEFLGNDKREIIFPFRFVCVDCAHVRPIDSDQSIYCAKTATNKKQKSYPKQDY
jgi:hypothetical protein